MKENAAQNQKRAYRFVGEILAGRHSASNATLLKLLLEWIMKN